MSDYKRLHPGIRQFLQGQVCLIVEPSQTFSASIQSCLHDLNLSLAQIITSRKFEDAKRIIHERRPKVVITEYEVEARFGLSLLEAQGDYYDELSRVSIIITRNTSDAVVAEAAEEEIDAYILKPFSPDVFRKRFLEVLERKVDPSEYIKKIREGKRQMAMNNLEAALAEFVDSKKLDKKPTLACFYAGQVYHVRGEIDKALAEYREGRKHQPLHYKCLMAEFENLIAREGYDEAYKLVPMIKFNYPVTPQRLGQIFIAAVFTQHFEDLEDYFQMFLKVEARSAKLVQLTSLALLTAGKFFLAKGDVARGCEFFEMGVTATSRDLAFLEKVIHELLQSGLIKEAENFLAKAHAHEFGTPEHNRLGFKVDRFVLSPDRVIEKGRRLVAEGHGNPEVYEALVRILATAGREPMAESIISKALETHPEMRVPLYKILHENLRKV
jgi:tetratricopeptide (TPR) repeat protein